MPDLRSGNLGNSGIVLRKQFKVKGMLYAKKILTVVLFVKVINQK